ncbi:MAG: hypothetical protein H7061_08305 [Bdellovibrionaceae bacterium]|nr:hypothetical protein [Bdellovibrio sp.]
MKNIFVKLTFICLFAAPVSSMAIVELRASYGGLGSNQSLKDLCTNCTNSSNAPTIVPTTGFGADLIVKIPLVPVGIGARYEGMGLNLNSNGYEAELKFTRTALLLNYRLIDTIVHFGPIVSYGLSHTGNLLLKENGITRIDFTASKMTSYTAGLELTVKPLVVLPLIVGAEAGYMGFKWDETTNSIDSSKKNVDLSGYYMKVFLGLDI